MRSCGAGMHRSAAEGRFGEAEPAGRASVCARAQTLGVHYKSTTGTFTYRRTKIAISTFIYRGARVFMPEKMVNLQRRFAKWLTTIRNRLYQICAIKVMDIGPILL